METAKGALAMALAEAKRSLHLEEELEEMEAAATFMAARLKELTSELAATKTGQAVVQAALQADKEEALAQHGLDLAAAHAEWEGRLRSVHEASAATTTTMAARLQEEHDRALEAAATDHVAELHRVEEHYAKELRSAQDQAADRERAHAEALDAAQAALATTTTIITSELQAKHAQAMEAAATTNAAAIRQVEERFVQELLSAKEQEAELKRLQAATLAMVQDELTESRATVKHQVTMLAALKAERDSAEQGRRDLEEQLASLMDKFKDIRLVTTSALSVPRHTAELDDSGDCACQEPRASKRTRPDADAVDASETTGTKKQKRA
jgi:hypothetical protein